MKLISCRYTWLSTVVGPVVISGGFAFCLWLKIRGVPLELAVPAIAFFLFCIAMYALRYFALVWPLADAVIDEGEVLVVRRRGIETRIGLDGIKQVHEGSGEFANIELTLAEPSPLGRKITFLPSGSWWKGKFIHGAIASDLGERARRARRALGKSRA